MGGGTLPGTAATASDAESDRVVFHVDMDCFYASCERLRRPELADEPVVVGMGYEAGGTIGAVATASYEARAFGVESAMPISAALELLPRRADADPDDPDAPDPAETGRYLPVDLEFYKDVASEVKAVIRDCADTRREVSIDEAYLDVTDRTSWAVAGGGECGSDPEITDAETADPETTDAETADPETTDPPPSTAAGPADVRTLAEGYARHVKSRIEREAGVPASVGVAPNMSAAKVASDADKPDGLVVVPPGTVADFLAPLPTADVHGVGPVTERTLAEMGIETAGDLAAADPDRLAEELGDRGRALSRRARGDDERAVTPTGLPKSLSRESSLPATDDDETKRDTVSALAADVARRARERGCLYRTIGIKAVEPPFEVNTRARSLPGPVDDPDLVEAVALDLLDEFDGVRVRKLGVRVSKLDFAEGDQATLSGFDAAEQTDGEESGPSETRAATGGDGSKLTDWVGAEPTIEEDDTDDGTPGDRPRRSEEGQASLGDWE
ncbi:DNA polymerase Y family protein [Halorubrum laminariae]|uniref:DNA polymerase IV n=1 Tax=Halorubrum laminariae TaxID=1433523 RepID=A0ABD6BYD4_9EURY|nr:DNA polymerase IV [Halorubrum laminariae]